MMLLGCFFAANFAHIYQTEFNINKSTLFRTKKGKELSHAFFLILEDDVFETIHKFYEFLNVSLILT